MSGLRVTILIALAAITASSAATLELAFRHVVGSEEVQPASLRYRNAAGEAYSITRVSWLVGGVALERTDGTAFDIPDHVQWIDFERGRTSLRLDGVPAGQYRSIRFDVGIKPELNHADSARFAPDHPLNPNLNGLHWNWQGGYVFLALEGMWHAQGAFQDGWSFHLARDTNLTMVSIPVALLLTNDVRVDIGFDVGMVLNGPKPVSFAKDGSSTHSRDGDPVAAALVNNLPGAFRALRVHSVADQGAKVVLRPLHLPRMFTPYRFTMSSTFPIPPLPQDNPLITERVELGERLFNESLLSRDLSISCASCHAPAAAFSDSRPVSIGVAGRTGTRNSMPLFNLAWKSTFFWDGRAPSLRAQALMPIQDHVEMNESMTNVVQKLQASQEYPSLFVRAFSNPEITAEKVGLALEQFLLTLTSFDSKFDRAARGEQTLNSQEQRGLELFMTEYDPRRGLFGADCFHCHGGPLFQSQAFANNGLDERFIDSGRSKVTHLSADDGKFAIPSLRNVELTGPYMHDGRFATLEEVVRHYSTGLKRSPTLDPNLAKHPVSGLQLSVADIQALVAFLKTLTDDTFKTNSPFARPQAIVRR